MYQYISGFLCFCCNHVLMTCYVYCEAYQCRWYIDIVKGSGHGILATDGRKSEANLCFISAQQSCKRLAPSFRLLAHAAEVLLEGESYFAIITACCHDFRQRFCHCVNGTVVWAPAGYIGIKAVAHHGHCICLTV